MEHNEFEHSVELNWAVKAGITDGTEPGSVVTKEETVCMLYRALEYFFGQIIGMLTAQPEDS